MTSRKILAQPYTTAISETLSQMPLNQMLLRADTCDNVSDILGLTRGGGVDYLHVVHGTRLEPPVVLSRPNHSLQQTPRETISKFQQCRGAALLNSSR